MHRMKTIDLHSHSYCSDGTFSPEGLILLAKKQGLSAIALTDHDTLDGLPAFLEAGEKYGIEAISGIELACLWEGFHRPELHLVGLGFDPSATSLTEKMKFLQESRTERNRLMAEKLTNLGMPLTLEEVEQNAGGEIVTRAHFANMLLKKGYIRTKEEAFIHYISPGMPAFVEREFFSPQECIDSIHKAGGIAVLAHPTLYGLADEQLDMLCKELAGQGLDAIECHYSAYTPAQRKAMKKFATRYKLLPSGGSDFHGENKPDIHLGYGRGNLEIPYSLWADMKLKIKQKKTASQPML